jgi:hypothetical protein
MGFFVDDIQHQMREENQDHAINQINAQLSNLPLLENIKNT